MPASASPPSPSPASGPPRLPEASAGQRRAATAGGVTPALRAGAPRQTPVCQHPDPWARAWRRLVWARLERVAGGRLTVEDGDGHRQFGRGGADSPTATIRVHDGRFYRQLVLGGSLGGADGYIRGYWTCDDLVALIRIFARDLAVSDHLDRGSAVLTRPVSWLAHALRQNTRLGSRRNIAAHYDLGNEFFALFLDPTMAYSCAVFPSAEATLEAASPAKFERICCKLELRAQDHLLEIGSGWGGFALHAAQRHGCRVTTTTVSRKQYEYTRAAVERAGLAGQVTVLCADYRDLEGTFDKLASIEMIEAVGHRYLDTYFRVCAQRLKDDGRMLLQAIVMPDQRYDRYRRSVDFTQRYIFPGGCLPSLGAICASVGRATDLQVSALEDLTPHYAETLARWRQRFVANLDQVRRQGFAEEFIRTWEFYLCYCEAGFRERVIGDVQLGLTKPGYRPGLELALRTS